MEVLKKEVSNLLEVCDKKIRPAIIEAPSIRRGLYKEIADYLYYLCASDGVVHEKEKQFINGLLDFDYTRQYMADYITDNDIYTKKFETTLPSIFTILLKDKEDAKLYMDVMKKVGKEFIVIDSKADERESTNYSIYMELLSKAYKKEHGDQEEESEEGSLEELIQELDDLIGLEDVKKNVHSLVHLQDIQLERERRNLPKVPISNHLVFTGNPGTGKTTVARLIAKIYKKLGVLSNGTFVETDRSGLVAGFVGQTAIKVNEVVDRAKGGILFIDEAYSLTSYENKNDFGHEAIEALLKRMEDERDDLVVIVAGYPDLMDTFIHSNPGLESRFRKKIHFEDYSPEELIEILKYMAASQKFVLEEKVIPHSLKKFKEQYKHRTADFANAREVRNCFESAIIKQADRLYGKETLSDEDLITLVVEDFE